MDEALGRLRISGDETIDGILFDQCRRQPRRHDATTAKAELEAKYLSPSTTFSAEWLNRLQQYVDNYMPLLALGAS